MSESIDHWSNSEVSLQTAFVCLLHLSNEEGIELKEQRMQKGDGAYDIVIKQPPKKMEIDSALWN